MRKTLDQLDALARDLQLRGIVTIADLDAVDSGIANELARRLAIEIKPAFGVDVSDAGDQLGTPEASELKLRRMDAIAAQSFGPARVSFW
jgi:hypothetical protein